jgi:predicted RNA-binding protein with PUA-like domain
MRYFLAKSEPGVYSIDDLESDGHTSWDGVTNSQAVRAIRAMRTGDRVFIYIYHSGGVSAVVGLAKVISEPRDDPKNPKSAVVD